MNTGLPLLAIGLIFGGGIGFTLAAANDITLTGHDHSAPAHHGGMAGMAGHDHDTPLVLPEGPGAPTLAIHATPDPVAGHNLHMMVENFTFSPQNASRPHVPGEGHAHVYVNGVKLGRYYGPWVHLDGLPEGEVTVEVTLNANDHRPLVVGETPLAATLTLNN